MARDAATERIETLDGRLQLKHILTLDDGTLRIIGDLLLNWHELVSLIVRASNIVDRAVLTAARRLHDLFRRCNNQQASEEVWV